MGSKAGNHPAEKRQFFAPILRLAFPLQARRLVLQTVLPALLTASKPSKIKLEGGTHNPAAPPFEFLERAFFPIINRMGPTVQCALVRHGFYPAGGGCLSISIEPAPRLHGFEIHERGEITLRSATAIVAHLAEQIAQRELEVVSRKLSWKQEWLQAKVVSDSHGPGNILLLEIRGESSHEVIAAFGARGVSAEAVAEHAADEARRYLASDAPVGVHLADQILLPLSIAGEGSYRTSTPSRHLRTNAEVIEMFLHRRIRMDPMVAYICSPTSSWNRLNCLSRCRMTGGRSTFGVRGPSDNEAVGPPPSYDSQIAPQSLSTASCTANTSNPVKTVARTCTIFPSKRWGSFRISQMRVWATETRPEPSGEEALDRASVRPPMRIAAQKTDSASPVSTLRINARPNLPSRATYPDSAKPTSMVHI